MRLAIFIPGIVYMAAAVGTQTEMLVVRGLAADVGIRRVFAAESLTGLVVGLVIAGVAAPAAALALGSWSIGLAVGLALVVACGAATIVAMVLPWAMSQMGADPAFGSGPLATVVQDLLSLAVYLLIARAIVG